VSVNPTYGIGATQGQRKTLTRLQIEPTTFGFDQPCSTDRATRSDGSSLWELKMSSSRQCICSCTLSCGVPQGWILRPFLFLLYINDLPNCPSNCQTRMHADDIHLTYASDNAHDIRGSLSADLRHVHNWLRTDKPTLLNMTKTEFVFIGSGQRLSIMTISPTFPINDFPVTKVNHC